MNATGYAGMVSAPKEPDTLNAMLTAIDREVEHAGTVLANVTSVADKLLGGVPREVGQSGGVDPEPGSMVHRLKMRQQRLFTLLSSIDEQISRIGNSI